MWRLTKFWPHESPALTSSMTCDAGRWASSDSLRVGAECALLQVPAAQSTDGLPYQQSARMSRPCADGYGRPPSPQVDRRKVRPHLCKRRVTARVRTCGAGRKDAMVELGGQGPLASSPRLNMSPSPRFPALLNPQHLTVASSCGEKQPMITARLSSEIWGESFNRGRQERCPPSKLMASQVSGLELLHALRRPRFGSQKLSECGARLPLSVGPRLPISICTRAADALFYTMDQSLRPLMA